MIFQGTESISILKLLMTVNRTAWRGVISEMIWKVWVCWIWKHGHIFKPTCVFSPVSLRAASAAPLTYGYTNTHDSPVSNPSHVDLVQSNSWKKKKSLFYNYTTHIWHVTENLFVAHRQKLWGGWVGGGGGGGFVCVCGGGGGGVGGTTHASEEKATHP